MFSHLVTDMKLVIFVLGVIYVLGFFKLLIVGFNRNVRRCADINRHMYTLTTSLLWPFIALLCLPFYAVGLLWALLESRSE